MGAHRPLGVLILVADGLHNLIGGLAVGSAFVIDTRLGIVTWLVAAAHEVPQELGDFGILVHSGWERRSALAFNVISAATFLAGSLAACREVRRGPFVDRGGTRSGWPTPRGAQRDAGWVT